MTLFSDTEMVCQEIHHVVRQDWVGCVYLSVPLVHNLLQQNLCTTGPVATTLPQELVYLRCFLWFGGNVVVGVPSDAIDIQYASQNECRATTGFDTSGKVFAVESWKCK